MTPFNKVAFYDKKKLVMFIFSIYRPHLDEAMFKTVFIEHHRATSRAKEEVNSEASTRGG